jgi:hypothetical protein
MTPLSKTSNPYSLSDRSAETGSSKIPGSIILNRLQTMDIYSADIPRISYRQGLSDSV